MDWQEALAQLRAEKPISLWEERLLLLLAEMMERLDTQRALNSELLTARTEMMEQIEVLEREEKASRWVDASTVRVTDAGKLVVLPPMVILSEEEEQAIREEKSKMTFDSSSVASPGPAVKPSESSTDLPQTAPTESQGEISRRLVLMEQTSAGFRSIEFTADELLAGNALYSTLHRISEWLTSSGSIQEETSVPGLAGHE